jgi:hypothetical protein
VHERGDVSARLVDPAEVARRTKSLDALLPILYLRGVSASGETADRACNKFFLPFCRLEPTSAA